MARHPADSTKIDCADPSAGVLLAEVEALRVRLAALEARLPACTPAEPDRLQAQLQPRRPSKTDPGHREGNTAGPVAGRRALGAGVLASLLAFVGRNSAHAAEALTISPDGKVGIGTTAPAATLDVVGGLLHVADNTGAPKATAQGAYLGWNALTRSTGETDFINNRGGGTGGFAFMNTPPSGDPRTTLMTISGAGDLDLIGTIKAQSLETKSGVSLAAVQNALNSLILVPIGTIIAHGGDTSNGTVVSALKSQGWLPCDGSSYSAQEYPELAKVIGNSFGTSRLPDLRGRFPRGTDHGARRDPDAGSRRSENGGNPGDKVGSVQDDEFKQHTHEYTRSLDHRGPDWASGNYWVPGQQQTGPAGGNETRPKNVYVNWIIRAK